MKKKSIKVTINEPCHEDWGKMTPNEKGRFCDSCAKPVIDFSTSTDIEIIQFLEEHKGQKTCGRFKATQLDRPIQRPYTEQTYSNFSLRTGLLGATLTSLLALESCKTEEPVMMGEVAATNNTEQPLHSVKPIDYEYTKGEVAIQKYDHTNERLITGVIYDVGGKQANEVQIMLYNQKGEELGKTLSNRDGSFRLPLDWSKEPYAFQCFIGDSQSEYFVISEVEQLQEMKIELIRLMMMGDIMEIPVDDTLRKK